MQYTMKSKVGIIILLVLVAVCAMGLYLFGGKTEAPPILYAHTSDGGVYELVMGGFTWEYMGTTTASDSPVYYELEYNKGNTIKLDTNGARNENIWLSESFSDNAKFADFEIVGMKEYVDGNEEENSKFEDNLTLVMLDSDPNSYFYEFEVEFSQGSVLYGLRIDKMGIKDKTTSDDLPKVIVPT